MPDPATGAARPDTPAPRDRRREPFELRPGGQRLLTVSEAAPFLRTTDVEYVYKLIREGALPATKLSPRKTLIRESDLYVFLHHRRA